MLFHVEIDNTTLPHSHIHQFSNRRLFNCADCGLGLGSSRRDAVCQARQSPPRSFQLAMLCYFTIPKIPPIYHSTPVLPPQCSPVALSLLSPGAPSLRARLSRPAASPAA
jgi:hypothetical protein